MKPAFGKILALVVGAAAFHFRLGFDKLNPSNTLWLLEGDASHHLLGWYFFRYDEWRFPLGVMKNLMNPIGAAIGATDSIPLFAVIFKIFQSNLSPEFQYFGLYLFLCFLLQGFFSYRLLLELTGRSIYSLAGAALMVFSAPLFDRIGHMALCAHWIIPASFLAYFKFVRGKSEPLSTYLFFLAINLFTASVHPYLLVMSLAFSFAFHLRLFLNDRQLKPRMMQTALLLSHVFAGTVVLWVMGYFWFESPGTGGFGYYCTDVLAFFNSFGMSILLPALRTRHGQYEGLAYLGLGGILVFAALVAAWRKKLTPRFWSKKSPYFPLYFSVLSLWIFALGALPKFFGFTFMDFNGLYALIEPLPGALRSSGRFVWPAFYAVLAASILSLQRVMGNRKSAMLIALAVVLQIVDLSPYYRPLKNHEHPANRFSASSWNGIGMKYRALALVPPIYLETPPECVPYAGFDNSFYIQAAHLAIREHMTYLSGMVSRSPTQAIAKHCGEFWKGLRSGTLDPTTYYLVSEPAVKGLGWLQNPQINCAQTEGIWTCVRRTASLAGS